MDGKLPCDTPLIPWDEQQGYSPREDGHCACGSCGLPLRDHKATWTRGEKDALRERVLRIEQAETRRALTAPLAAVPGEKGRVAEPTEADKVTARRIAGECHCAPAAQCGACKHFYEPILAALAEAREVATIAATLKIALELDCHPACILDETRRREQRAREDGRREERRACWWIAQRMGVPHHYAELVREFARQAQRIIADAIAARGPMGEL